MIINVAASKISSKDNAPVVKSYMYIWMILPSFLNCEDPKALGNAFLTFSWLSRYTFSTNCDITLKDLDEIVYLKAMIGCQQK